MIYKALLIIYQSEAGLASSSTVPFFNLEIKDQTFFIKLHSYIWRYKGCFETNLV